jgi:5-methylcytosine-specific restriction endonuclease McrA
MALKPCLGCGRLSTGSRCPACRRASPYHQADWRRLSREVVARDGACVECGSPGPHLQAHHVDPRREGGIDATSNLVTLCASCHARLRPATRRYWD